MQTEVHMYCENDNVHVLAYFVIYLRSFRVQN